MRARAMVGLVVVLVAAVGLGLELRAERAAAQATLAQIEAALAQDERLAGEVPRLEREANQVVPGGAVPNELDTAALVGEISDAAAAAGVRVTGLGVGSPVPKAGLYDYPVTVQVAGGELAQARFLHTLEEGARLVQVASWTATPTGGTAIVDVFAATDGGAGSP
jgi:Tfp pilus assembly protein PilO